MFTNWYLMRLSLGASRRLAFSTQLPNSTAAASAVETQHRFLCSSGSFKKYETNETQKSGSGRVTKVKHPEESYWQKQKKHLYDQLISAVFQQRQYSSSSSGSNPPPEKLPPLMNFPHIMWPKVTHAIRNWLLTKFVINPHMDKEFDIKEFDKGARQALSFISECLAKGKLEDLNGIVSSEALVEITENLQHLTLGQRESLAVSVEDIYFSFPYQIGIIIPDTPSTSTSSSQGWMESGSSSSEPPKRPPQTRYVEITVAFHVLRGLAQQASQDGEQRHFLEFLRQEDTKYKVMVCNYRFWRDFTEGVTDSSWIVNIVSHFLPAAEGK